MSALQVQIGGRTVNVQVYSSGVARALEAIRESAASEAAAAASETAAAASAAAAAQSEANAAATLAAAALKANNLSDLTNAATARANLGLTIGTHVQAYDADLTAIAALTSAADKVPYATGAGTWAMADLTSFARSLLATASNSAFLTALGNIASSFINFVQSGTGAVTRTLQAWGRERAVSVKDFGATGDGTTDDTAAVQAAYAAGNYDLYFPPGTYRLGQTGLLGAAGLRIRGAGRGSGSSLTIIKPIASLTTGQAIFYNQAASPATAAFITIEDITFDLIDQNCVAVDLDRVNNANINRCHFEGGPNLAGAVGVGVKFNATTASGSYTNTVTNCSFQYLAKGVEFGSDANSCMVVGGEFIGCTIGADCAPTGNLDTPRIIGARFEGGGVGIQDKATGGNYIGCRFEDNATADIEFVSGSTRPLVVGGYTATTVTSLLNLSNATSPVIHAPDMGWYEIEATTNKKHLHGRHVFATYNTAINPTVPSGIDYAAYFYDSLIIRNQIPLEFGNAAGTGSVISVAVDGSNRTTIRSYNRATATDGDVLLGAGSAVLPFSNNVTDIGTNAVRYKDGYFFGDLFANDVSIDGIIYIDGVPVLGPQGAAVADAVAAAGAPTQTEFNNFVTQFNALLARCRAHGLIAT